MTPTSILEPALAVPAAVRDDDALYEIIDGKRVELPPMSVRSSRVASRLHGALIDFNKAHDIGEPVVETVFRLPLDRDRNRRPDIAFVSYERWPRGRDPENDNAWEVAPDLAVEVTSPTDRADEVAEKLVEYFQAGVRLVWVVYPVFRLIYVYESLTKVCGLTAADELDGGAVLPGFRTPVATLFPEAAPPT